MNLQTIKLSQHTLTIAFKAACDAESDVKADATDCRTVRISLLSPTDVCPYRHAYRVAKRAIRGKATIYEATTQAEYYLRYLEMVGAERAVRNARIAGVG